MMKNYKSSVSGLCNMARDLGYKDPCSQLINRDGSCVGDFLVFLEDNPGAIEAVFEWAMENHDMDSDEDEDEDEDENDLNDQGE
jgi:hypothetical protein